MTKPHRIYPHGQPIELAPGLWQVEGSLDIPGLPRNMTVLRLDDGTLLLHSAVAMDDAGLAALTALGKPAILVAPHPFHVMDAGFYVQRFPDLRVLANDDARVRLTERGVQVHGRPEDELPQLGVRVHRISGTRHEDDVLDLPVRRADGSESGRAALFTDLIGNVPKRPGFNGFLLNLLGSGGKPGIPRIVKFRQVVDKAATADFLMRMAALPDLRMVLVAHGAPILSGAREALELAAERV